VSLPNFTAPSELPSFISCRGARAHHQKNFVVAGVLGLIRFVDGNGAVNVFLIPKAVYQHHGNFERLRSEDLSMACCCQNAS